MKKTKFLMSLAVIGLLYSGNLMAATDKVQLINQELSVLEAERLDLTQEIDSLVDQLKANDNPSKTQELKEKRRVVYLRNKTVTDKINDLTRIKSTPTLLEKYSASVDTNYAPIKEVQEANIKAKKAAEDTELKAKMEAEKIETDKKAFEKEQEKLKAEKAKLSQEEFAKKQKEEEAKMATMKAEEAKLDKLKQEATLAKQEAEKAKAEMDKINKQKNIQAQAELSKIANVSDKEIEEELAKLSRDREALDSKRIDSVLESQKKIDKIKALSGQEKIDVTGKSAEEISKTLGINKSELKSEDWEKVFGNNIKMKKYKLNQLDDKSLETMKNYLTK